MTSINCPKCKSHISEWDVICLKCGHTLTPEEREQLVKQQEELAAYDTELKSSAYEKEMKLKPRHHLQKKLDKFLVDTFGVTIDVITVFIVALILLAAAAVFMLM